MTRNSRVGAIARSLTMRKSYAATLGHSAAKYSDVYGYTDVNGQTRDGGKGGNEGESPCRILQKRPFLAGFSLPGKERSAILKGLLIGRTPNLLTLLCGGHVTFQVGDKVIYPNHGLGVVQGIETKTILGTTCGFYHLRMVANETTVLVPVDNVDGVSLRRAINDEEIERLFSLLGDGKIDNHQNWKGRFKDNSDRMRTGSIYDVVEVLKSLTFLARSKNLSFREKRMLDRAKFLVVSEISEVSHEITSAIEEKVDRALERCFTVKNRSIARAKAAKAATPTRVTARRTAKAS